MAELPHIPALRPVEVLERGQRGATLLDTRPAAEFGAAHVPGSLHIGLNGQYASWAGTLLGLDSEIVLIAEDEERVTESRTRLARVGIERVTGYLGDGIAAWTRDGLPVGQVPQISVEELHRLPDPDRDGLQLVDVRRQPEWDEGHIAGAVHKPLHKLARLTDSLDLSRPVAVYCKGGYRSSIAASLLKRAGFTEIINVTGGFDAWRACQVPVAS